MVRAPVALVVGVLAGSLVSGGVAQAWWSNGSSGAGDGTASVSRGNDRPITIVLTSKPSGLAPGKSVVLSGNFNNPNNGNDGGKVLVRTVTVSIVGVDKPGCTLADFRLSKPTTAVNTVIPAGTGVGHWGGDLNLSMFNDPRRDQGACHGATVRLHMTSN